jgi:hypothetical protein
VRFEMNGLFTALFSGYNIVTGLLAFAGIISWN